MAGTRFMVPVGQISQRRLGVLTDVGYLKRHPRTAVAVRLFFAVSRPTPRRSESKIAKTGVFGVEWSSSVWFGLVYASSTKETHLGSAGDSHVAP